MISQCVAMTKAFGDYNFVTRLLDFMTINNNGSAHLLPLPNPAI